jgi:uncharacterized Zn-binding protein involved in type VI secretion
MPPVVRMGVDMCTGPILMPLQGTVFVGGSLWAVLGTPVTPHAPGPHLVPFLAQANFQVYVGGIPSCRAGHTATCGCPAAPGFPTVQMP